MCVLDCVSIDAFYTLVYILADHYGGTCILADHCGVCGDVGAVHINFDAFYVLDCVNIGAFYILDHILAGHCDDCVDPGASYLCGVCYVSDGERVDLGATHLFYLARFGTAYIMDAFHFVGIHYSLAEPYGGRVNLGASCILNNTADVSTSVPPASSTMSTSVPSTTSMLLAAVFGVMVNLVNMR